MMFCRIVSLGYYMRYREALALHLDRGEENRPPASGSEYREAVTPISGRGSCGVAGSTQSADPPSSTTATEAALADDRSVSAALHAPESGMAQPPYAFPRDIWPKQEKSYYRDGSAILWTNSRHAV